VELHLDIAGRMTGDMFIAALLDAFPGYEEFVIEAIDAASEAYPVDCRLQYVRENHLRGQHFIIEPYTQYFGHLNADPDEERESWGVLRQRLQSANLPAGVRRHAFGVLLLMTRERAGGLDSSLDAVTFSKNEASQMIAQAVGAAAVIDSLGSATWTAFASSRYVATAIGRAILTHLGTHPQYSQTRAPNFSRSILSSTGVGLAGPGDAHVRVTCFDELGAGHVPGTQAEIPTASDQQGSRS
jgi:uncharacterized protein (DUF111 family)